MSLTDTNEEADIASSIERSAAATWVTYRNFAESAGCLFRAPGGLENVGGRVERGDEQAEQNDGGMERESRLRRQKTKFQRVDGSMVTGQP